MINCIAIDDEPAALGQIARYLQKIPDVRLIGSTTRPKDGLKMAQEMSVDALFLDMEMDEMTGTEVMRRLDPTIKVVVCTAYSEYSIQSFELDAVDYLLKPVEFDRFAKAVERLKERILKKTLALPVVKNDYIFVKFMQRGSLKKIDFSDIIYVEARDHDVVFHKHNEFVIAYMGMNEVESKLRPSDGFLRINRSYIVSVKMIDMISEGMVKLKSKKELPLGGKYKEYVLNILDPR
ncbi:LytR/AlgR family response regulator transcription factor [Olivibacter jilunii]|uniref:LytR/AlgR family response regulator transcription factor n=1 Tax=Olivibacter jilunii TaxID=985016 RepID=UPI001031F8C6|nr:LytTR family DNA-binding domain-containing protein [Olivibacter jilunii]